VVLASACSHSAPSSKETVNACDIFEDRKSWFRAMKRAEKRWDTPVHVQLAIMRQESSFEKNARPPRSKILWVIPGPRKSSSYGFAQAQKGTWDWYKKSSGRGGADRNDFSDSADFIAWYGKQSLKKSGISPWDTYNLYLSYHEGHGGYNRGSYKNKDWLLNVARKVERNAGTYQTQLKSCEKRLARRF
jgi:hypothetical protein